MSVHKFGGMSHEQYIRRDSSNVIQFKRVIPPSHETTIPENVATKEYVDSKLRKCYVGFIPNLEADTSQTGFKVSASSARDGYSAYGAFNNVNDEGFNGSWKNASRSVVPMLHIACPFKVIVWRFAIKAGGAAGNDILGFVISGSNDDRAFTPLIRSTERLTAESLFPTFFDIDNTTAYK